MNIHYPRRLYSRQRG